MNSDVENHLSRYNQARADEEARQKASHAARIANLERIGEVAKAALHAHVVPELKELRDSVLDSGLHGELHLLDVLSWQSNVGDSARDYCRVRVSLELGKGRSHELTFTGWITESAWKVRTSIMSADSTIRASVPDEDFPGTDEYRLAAWARERALAFLKAVFPI
jgi:hypothetical protein